MKNAIGAVIILFVLYLHLLVVPPRNLRGSYYKNIEAANQNRTCNYEWHCNPDLSGEDRETYCGEEPEDSNRPEDRCVGACLRYETSVNGEIMFRGRRCIDYCETYCLDIEDGVRSCFDCCYGEKCNE